MRFSLQRLVSPPPIGSERRGEWTRGSADFFLTDSRQTGLHYIPVTFAQPRHGEYHNAWRLAYFLALFDA